MHREVLYEERKMFPTLNVLWSPLARSLLTVQYLVLSRLTQSPYWVAPICAYLFTLSRALVPAWLC